jgi:hypothetical protein
MDTWTIIWNELQQLVLSNMLLTARPGDDGLANWFTVTYITKVGPKFKFVESINDLDNLKSELQQ